MHMYMPYRQSLVPQVGSQDLNGKTVQLRDVILFLRRFASIIIGSTLLFAGLAAAYIILVPPSYRATAQVMVENRQTPYFFKEPDFASEPVTDQSRVESQIEVIRSGQIASTVIQRLHLDQRPEFSPRLSPIWDWLGLREYVNAAQNWVQQLLPSAPLQGREARQGYAAEVFAKQLSVRRMGQSLVIEVAFRSEDGALAAQVTNAVIDAYRG